MLPALILEVLVVFIAEVAADLGDHALAGVDDSVVNASLLSDGEGGDYGEDGTKGNAVSDGFLVVRSELLCFFQHGSSFHRGH